MVLHTSMVTVAGAVVLLAGVTVAIVVTVKRIMRG